MDNLKAVSLFSSGGIGDLALRECGIDTMVANELLEERAKVFEFNYQKTKMVVGDIWSEKNRIIHEAKQALKGSTLDILFATPPCQGMSKNGRGKLLNGIRKGLKPKFDKRNQLIIPTIDIIRNLKPTTIIFENVPEMKDTIILSPSRRPINIIEFIRKSLCGYTGDTKTVEFADYGVPQRRRRLITIFTKDKKLLLYYAKNGTFLPPKTHSQNGTGETLPWKTLKDAIGKLPPLDASTKQKAVSATIPYHKVPVLDGYKYFWVRHTPKSRSAFDNQCVNPKCMFEGNQLHGASKGKDGINRAHKKTPIRCEQCTELLPRPWVERNGKFRLMKGYTSAYKRMDWNLPSSTLTRNLSYACSDNKLHPDQNRVLSLYEAFIIHTINDFNYSWKRIDGNAVSDKCIREIIGESIPPKGLTHIFNQIVRLKSAQIRPIGNVKATPLYYTC